MRLEPGSPKPAEGQGWRAVCPGASGCSGLGTSRPAPRCGAGMATHASGAGDKKKEPLPAFLGVCTEADVAPGLGRWLLVSGKPAGFPWVVLPLFRGNFCWFQARGSAEEEQPSQPEIWAVPHGGNCGGGGEGGAAVPRGCRGEWHLGKRIWGCHSQAECGSLAKGRGTSPVPQGARPRGLPAEL